MGLRYIDLPIRLAPDEDKIFVRLIGIFQGPKDRRLGIERHLVNQMGLLPGVRAVRSIDEVSAFVKNHVLAGLVAVNINT